MNQTTVNLRRGGKITFFKNLITTQRSDLIRDAVLQCKQLRQYSSRRGMYKEPINHVLLSSGPRNSGYRYGTVCMKAQPLSSLPSVSELGDEIARYVGLSKNQWNIGVDLVVYRDQNDGVGWHSDSHQGENVIFTVILESPNDSNIPNKTSRPINVQTIEKQTLKWHGDEYIQLFPSCGDAYVMNQKMQDGYKHSIPKQDKELDRRTVLVFRNGQEQIVGDDSGYSL